MLLYDFTVQAGDAATTDLYAFERTLRQNLLETLRVGFDRDRAAPMPADALRDKHRETLSTLLKITSPHHAYSLIHRYEETKALAAGKSYIGFHEALVTVHCPDHDLSMLDVREALENPAFNSEADRHFRLWLMTVQIIDFYKTHDKDQRISVNVVPMDVDHDDFRQGLTKLMEIVKECGYTPMVLEATEYSSWAGARSDFLKGLKSLGAIIAIDDYGCPHGYNDASSLDIFNIPTDPDLIVKIDGKIVRSFMDKDDMSLVQHLRNIQARTPDAIIVAEWVNSCAETKELCKRLKTHGLENIIHFVQSYTITESSGTFLQNMNEPVTPAPSP